MKFMVVPGFFAYCLYNSLMFRFTAFMSIVAALMPLVGGATAFVGEDGLMGAGPVVTELYRA